jgi:tetratricopeptide (TPR) repeat protein
MLKKLLKDLFANQEDVDQRALVQAKFLVQSLQFRTAEKILDALLDRSPSNAPALMLRAATRRSLENPRGAIADLELARESSHDKAACDFELALCWSILGDNSQALANCERARQLDPSSVPSFFLLTQLRLPGDYYFEVLAKVIGHVKPTTYVEIGIFRGESLRLATSASAIVGIDPDPKINGELAPHVKVFKTTSDAFFAKYDLSSEIGYRPVDLAFIDGMHQFEFAMRDFANLERYCRRESVILIHDCYPLDEESAGREPRLSRWSGDVWRLIVLLKKYRSDLLIHTIGTAPTGLAVIQNLDPESTFLMDNQSHLVEEFLALDYSYLKDDKPAKLNFFPNQWTAIQAMVRPCTE